MSQHRVEQSTGMRAIVVILAALVSGFLLYFAGVPLLGYIIFDWGRFLAACVALFLLYLTAVGVGVCWAMRGRNSRS